MQVNDVVDRLLGLGFPVDDQNTLSFCVQKTEDYIRSFCNIQEIPDTLHHTAVDMAAGTYLENLKDTGQLTGFDYAIPVKSLKEGDTNVEFAIGSGGLTAEQRMEKLIDGLIHGGREVLMSCRRIAW